MQLCFEEHCSRVNPLSTTSWDQLAVWSQLPQSELSDIVGNTRNTLKQRGAVFHETLSLVLWSKVASSELIFIQRIGEKFRLERILKSNF